MTPSAVIFDLDGVIAATENLKRVAWESTLGRVGLELPQEDWIEEALERPDPLFLLAFLKSQDIDPETADVVGWCRRKQKLMSELLSEGTSLVPGAGDLIHAIGTRARLALATGSCRSEVDAALTAAGAADVFEPIVTGDTPGPRDDPAEPFRVALDRLGLRPERAVTLVGSKRGRLASIQAGIRMVSIGPPPIRADLASGDLAVPNLRDTAAVLAALGLD